MEATNVSTAAKAASTISNGGGKNGNSRRKSAMGLRDGWFSETEAMWPGQKFSLALEGFSEEKSVLFSGKSAHQSILVFRSAQYGNVLVLDGVIQVTERDEFAFQEMMAHIPMFSHPCPKNILVVGGGDGGVLREVCRHDSVESVTLVEIDPMVTDVAKAYFPQCTGQAFADPRVTIIHEDAAEFLRRENEAGKREIYDVIIADTSDPVGPAETLFEPTFYEHMHEALRDGGIVCAQGECFWIHLDLITNMVACCHDIFDSTDYATTMVPTYPCGQIGFIVAGKGVSVNFRTPSRHPSPQMQAKLRWYNPSVHRSSFILPTFVERRLSEIRPTPKWEIDGKKDPAVEPKDARGGSVTNDGEDSNDCFLTKCAIM